MQVIDCAGRDSLSPRKASIIGAVARAGGVILLPTDTLYGLGVDPRSTAALAALFRLKGRDPEKPLPVLLADLSEVGRYAAAIPAPWRALTARFWPGPLTLLFPALPGLEPGIRSSTGKVALRVPGSALCRAVIRAAGGSLTGTSANAAGEEGTGDPDVVVSGLGIGIDLFVNAGTLPVSEASTILDLAAEERVTTLRRGALPLADVRQALNRKGRGG